MKKTIYFSLLLIINTVYGQNLNSKVLSLEEYLGYVKQFHPIVKQARLVIDESDAKLLKSRGAFDPKIEIDFDKKQFKGTNYYDQLNATFKIPTWYGIELKANFEENEGEFLNRSLNVPNNGLYSAGVTVSLARGFLMNERMAMLKQAKLFQEQAKADQIIVVNEILLDASKAYFNWLKTYTEKEVYASFVVNAKLRFKGVKRSFEMGERASIDTLETGISVNDRKLNLEKATIKHIKTSLKLSNFLWLDNNIPVELKEDMIPNTATYININSTLNLDTFNETTVTVEALPKLVSLDRKFQNLTIDKRLKANKLLPVIDLEYNFLTQKPTFINSFDQNQYKGGLTVKLPLFLRKERGDLQLSKLKLQDISYEIASTKLTIRNKIKAIAQEINSLEKQQALADTMIADYEVLLEAENRKFFLGESSIFLVNSRESKLIGSKLKAIQIMNNFLNSKATLSNIIANNTL